MKALRLLRPRAACAHRSAEKQSTQREAEAHAIATAVYRTRRSINVPRHNVAYVYNSCLVSREGRKIDCPHQHRRSKNIRHKTRPREFPGLPRETNSTSMHKHTQRSHRQWTRDPSPQLHTEFMAAHTPVSLTFRASLKITGTGCAMFSVVSAKTSSDRCFRS